MRNVIMIKPISYAMQRTQCKNIFQKLTNNVLRSKKNQSITNLKYVMPYVAVPIVAYNTKTDANERTLAQNLEKGKAHTPVTDNTETNTKALRKAGIRKKDINKELDKDGNLKNESTKKDLDSKKISHKGAPDDQHFDVEAQDDLVLSKDEMKILHEMNSIDIQMDPVLQEIHDAPPLDTVEGLMTSIFGEIPAGVNFDWDLWSALKEIANDIMDIGDWM